MSPRWGLQSSMYLKIGKCRSEAIAVHEESSRIMLNCHGRLALQRQCLAWTVTISRNEQLGGTSWPALARHLLQDGGRQGRNPWKDDVEPSFGWLCVDAILDWSDLPVVGVGFSCGGGRVALLGKMQYLWPGWQIVIATHRAPVASIDSDENRNPDSEFFTCKEHSTFCTQSLMLFMSEHLSFQSFRRELLIRSATSPNVDGSAQRVPAINYRRASAVPICYGSPFRPCQHSWSKEFHHTLTDMWRSDRVNRCRLSARLRASVPLHVQF